MSTTGSQVIEVHCPSCKAVYHSQEAHVGKRLRCTNCGSIVPIIEGGTETLRHVQVEAKRATTPPAKRNCQFRSKRSVVFAGAFLALSLVLWAAWHHSNDDAAAPITSSDARPKSNEPVSLETKIPELSADQVEEPSDQAKERHNLIGVPKPLEYRSLPTGTRLSGDFCTKGHGKLTISNGTGLDAVMRLYDNGSNEIMCSFFVKAKSGATLTHIPRGTYTLVYTSGLDWNDAQEVFRWNPTYYEFEHALEYSEQSDAAGVWSHDISITLHPVIGGNVRTKEISRDAFLKGHQHILLEEPQSGPSL